MIPTRLVVWLLCAASAVAAGPEHGRNVSARAPKSPSGFRANHRAAGGVLHLFRHPFVTFAAAVTAHEDQHHSIALPTGQDSFIRFDEQPSFRGAFFDSPKRFNSHNSLFDSSSIGGESNAESRVLPFNNVLLRDYVTSLTALPRLTGLNPVERTPCKSPNAESGICTPSRICSAYGGRASGSCGPLGSVCCINTVNRCGSVVTLNNTYWQSSAPIDPDSTCSLTVRLNPILLEQRKNPICQVRLDFEVFNIGQPNSQTVCSTDTFRVGGAVNKVPVICGHNGGQHMYLMAPSPTSDLQLVFSLGALTTVERSWRIRIGLLPCSANYLAPVDCLQYFTQTTGTVRSFNWRETSPLFSFPRQLANQDYNICFRSEEITGSNTFSKVASSICFAPCLITTQAIPPQLPPLAFSLTGDSTIAFPPGATGAGIQNTQCLNTDFVIIEAAVDSNVPLSFNDRFCGNQLTATAGPLTATLCTTVKPFKLYYRTDGSETVQEAGNNGFCLRFEQRA